MPFNILLIGKYWQNKLLVSIAIATAIANGSAFALPEGENVIAGDVSVDSVDHETLNINQSSSKAIIEWQSFDINANETVNVFQPTNEAILLNRVLSEDPSKILGQLNANSHVWVLNSGGVIFGDNAKVDVGGLLATTANIDDSDFLAGRYEFDNTGLDGAFIVNTGDITASGGVVALLAPNVTNSGTIRARFGKIVLASTDRFTIDFYGDGLINIALDDINESNTNEAYTATNAGALLADAGQVQMSVAQGNATVERLIENKWTGRIQANSVDTDTQGQIILGGGTNDIDNNTTVLNAGIIEAIGSNDGETGGDIRILGDQIAMLDGAVVDASGSPKGGNIKIGGEYLGQDDTKRARATIIQEDATIKANGGDGEVIVWSDEYTNFQGKIEADGGGGFVETSSKEILSATGLVSAEDGQWLLDPGNIDIRDDAGGGPDDSTIAGPLFDSSGVDSIVTTEAIETGLVTADVTLVTSGGSANEGDITVTDTIQYTGATPRTLTLRANDDIIINNATINSTTGVLNVLLNTEYDRVSKTLGDGFVDIRNSSFSTNGGDFIIGGGADPYLNPVISGGINSDTTGNLDPAIYIENTPINTLTGDVLIHGINSILSGSQYGRTGVQIIGGQNITTSEGNITIRGTTQHLSTLNRGVILDAGLFTDTGAVEMIGVATSGEGILASSFNTSIVQTGLTGAGDINLTGTTNTAGEAVRIAGNNTTDFSSNFNITANGGDLMMARRTIQKIGADDSSINLQSTHSVRLEGNGATDITTTGNAVNINVTADSDNNGTGDVLFDDYGLNLNGGDLSISGNSIIIGNTNFVSNNSGSGNIIFNTDAFALNTSDSSLQAAEKITIAPLNDTTLINIGTGSGGLDVSLADLNQFTVGDTLTIGSRLGTGVVNIDNVDLTGGGYDLAVYGGAMSVNNGLTNDGSILLITNNNQDLTLNSAVTSNAAGNALVLNATGNFINNFGESALNPGTGRFVVYSQTLDGIVYGGLTGEQLTGQTFSSLPPLSISNGLNSFVFVQDTAFNLDDNILIDPDVVDIPDDSSFIVDDFVDDDLEAISDVFLDFGSDDNLSFSFDGMTENTAVVFDGSSYDVIDSNYMPQIGDYIRTGLDFGFMFESDENAIIKMTRSSALKVKNVFYAPDGKNSQYFKVEEGSVGFFSDREQHKGEVKTILPGVAIKVTGTCYIVDLKKETNTTNIILFGGGIELYIKGNLVKLNHPIQMISFGSDGSKAVDPTPLSVSDVKYMFAQKPEIIPSNSELLKCGVPPESL